MKYSIRVIEVKGRNEQEGSLKGFATVVFGDSFKITNIAILENRDNGKLFVSMPRYKSNEHDENGGVVYKDVCNPITAEFREELYSNILDEYARVAGGSKDKENAAGEVKAGEAERNAAGQTKAEVEAKAEVERNASDEPDFSVTVVPYTREGSNIRGLVRVYFDDCFIVNNISLVQGKENVFVAMPSYKTSRTDEQGKSVYQDICYPVTKEFREKLYAEIYDVYEASLERQREEIESRAEKEADRENNKKNGRKQGGGDDGFIILGDETPFR